MHFSHDKISLFPPILSSAKGKPVKTSLIFLSFVVKQEINMNWGIGKLIHGMCQRLIRSLRSTKEVQ
jgi:hypothetical protein